MTVSTLPGASVPSGDCAFTLFFVGTVKKKDGMNILMSWGDMYKIGRGSAIEIQSGRLDWATGWGADAVTADGSFNDYFDRPAVICIRKRPGLIYETTSIWVNGKGMPLAETSSSRTPNVQPGDILIGGRFFGSDMTVGEVILYNRALTDGMGDRVGSYLAKKYKLHTAYSGGDKAIMPNQVNGLCAWFKVAAPERPERAAAAVYKDNFNSYADGTQLRANLGKLKWSRAVVGAGDQQLKVVDGVVERHTPGPWAKGAFATTPLHQGVAYARVQADVKYSAYNNANYAGVFLNATKWVSRDIGKYGHKNLYKASIDTEGFFCYPARSGRPLLSHQRAALP